MRGLAEAALGAGSDVAALERFKVAPIKAPLRRLDETLAARKPRLKWSAPS